MPIVGNQTDFLEASNFNPSGSFSQQQPSFGQDLSNLSLSGTNTGQGGFQNPNLGTDINNLNLTSPGTQDQGFFGNLDMQGVGQGLQGLAGVGQFGLGVANYFQNKSNFKDMMNLQLADRKTQLGLANQSLSAERARLKRLGVSDANLKDVPTSVS